MENSLLLSGIEELTYKLRTLYFKYGYQPYHMSKFEEYDLYAKHKDFLVSSQVITFNDSSKLMALKPDVTLSIIKNSVDDNRNVYKYCYNENVYRVSKGTSSFKELMQVGLECFGGVDEYNVAEVLYLALKSLSEISDSFMLNVSNLDLILAFVGAISKDADVQNELIKCVSEKNFHGIYEVLDGNAIDRSKADDLIRLLKKNWKYSELDEVREMALRIGVEEKADDLIDAVYIFNESGFEDKVSIDFSLISNRHYYNGLIFKGYVEGVSEEVLGGGQYDKLIKAMNHHHKAIGFAVYVDALERLLYKIREYDADIMLVYGDACNCDIKHVVWDYTAKGISVFTTKEFNSNIKAREVKMLKDGEVKEYEND